MLVCWLLLVGHEGTILSDDMTTLSRGCWLIAALSNLSTDLTKLTCKRWLSNGLIYLIVNGLLSDILPQSMGKLTSGFSLSDVLPAPMIDLTWNLGPHDLTWNLKTNLTRECWLGDDLLVSLTNMNSGCWLIDILPKPGADLTG